MSLSEFVRVRTRNLWRSRLCTAAVGLVMATVPAQSQIQLTHTEDAAPVPGGMLRFRITTGWSRYDSKFTSSGTQSLDSELSTDSLGALQFPRLAPIQSAIQLLGASPASRLSFGRLDIRSDVRTVTTPIALEYGITNRFSIGIVVPVIQTRRNIRLTVNADTNAAGNATYLAARLRGNAAIVNSAVISAFQRAADSIGTLITKCPSAPASAGCAAVLSNPSDAAAARLQAAAYADRVRTAFGADSASSLVAIRSGSTLASVVDAQRLALNAKLTAYLGQGAGSPTPVFTTAERFSYVDLQGRGTASGFLGSTLGGGLDSLQTINRLTIAGISVGAQYLLFDGFIRDSTAPNHFQSRLAVGGVVNFQGVPADSSARIGAISPGSGAGVEMHSALDVITGKLGGTLVAHYRKSFAEKVNSTIAGDPSAFFPYPSFADVTRTAGDVFGIDVTPRLLVGRYFALDGHYGFEHTGPATYADIPAVTAGAVPLSPSSASTAQRLGFGFRYSTIDSFLSGRTSTPMEVSFTHLETFAGDPGVAKISRDQIQVRLYFGSLKKR